MLVTQVDKSDLQVYPYFWQGFMQHSSIFWIYYSEETGAITYDANWRELPYFISSRETAFEMSLLTKLDADILIGVMSYKQSADIYNYTHGYNKGFRITDEEELRSVEIIQMHVYADLYAL